MTSRIAIIDETKCKPSKCGQECKKSCPIVHQGKLCIEVNKQSKLAFISETLCIGCGICVKKCPFKAISIINTPANLDQDIVHRYGPNTFKLHRLPIPRVGQILGLIGKNGIGKSTVLKILSGQLHPNLGKFDATKVEWSDILQNFRGSELHNYLSKIANNELKSIIKPQYIEAVSRKITGTVNYWLHKKCTRYDAFDDIIRELELNDLLDHDVKTLSGGELQRFTIAMSCIQQADVYIFDEPSSYLDVRQRLNVAKLIRGMLTDTNYVIVVEHDLSVLDYLSDFVCVLYGTPSAYGVVTMPYSVREGINVFLDGFIPTENMRFRDCALNFKLVETADKKSQNINYDMYTYPDFTYTINTFTMSAQQGGFNDSSITVLLGENGTGKTTFINILAGFIKIPDVDIPDLMISYKPQKIIANYEGDVRSLLHSKIRSAMCDSLFYSEIIKPIDIESLYNSQVKHLSGGELQRVAIALCLGKPANVYLIDEPSAYLDAEQRVIVAKIIKRYIMHSKKSAFIIEHDLIMATYLADKVIVFQGKPSVSTYVTPPLNLLSGMNLFLKSLNITFRRDPNNFRPRINKLNSQKDNEQKISGNFFFQD